MLLQFLKGRRLDVGDISVDSFFNTKITFSKFCGGRICNRTSKLSYIAMALPNNKFTKKNFQKVPKSITTLIDLGLIVF